MQYYRTHWCSPYFEDTQAHRRQRVLENGYALFFKSSFRKVLGCAGYSRGSPCGVKVKVRESSIEEKYWWSRGGSNSWPPHCELDTRQKRKLLPFRKLQPPRDLKGFRFFPIRYHRVPVACSYFCPRTGHLEINPPFQGIEMPNWHLKLTTGVLRNCN